MGHVFFAREVADGEFLGDYQVLNVLGRGPTGCTYHVTSVSLGKEFALKSFVLGDAVDLSWVDRLEAETALLGKLAHPHIDRVVNSGKSRNLHFLLKDYVHDGDGNACDLRKYLERHGGVLSHFQAYHVVDQVISALQWAEEYQDPHHTGLIHGNLKPENILMGYLSQTGAHLPFEIRLTDFQPYGLMDGQVVLDTYRQWKVGVSLGYPGEQAKLNALEGIYRAFDYFPPEKMLSVQGDMFSLGVIIYEMLTGQLPYGRFASPRELRPELPLGWDVLIERALQASPRLRPESWAEFRAVFEETDRGILREISQEFQEENVQEAFPRKERHSLTPAGMVYIPGGTLLMGSGECGEDALPQHEVEVSGFYLDRTPVTVRYFARFVAETGYQTEAEKVGEAPVWSQGQWKAVPGACWKSPHGLAIPEDFESHPVTQVSFWMPRPMPRGQVAAFLLNKSGSMLPRVGGWIFVSLGETASRFLMPTTVVMEPVL